MISWLRRVSPEAMIGPVNVTIGEVIGNRLSISNIRVAMLLWLSERYLGSGVKIAELTVDNHHHV